MNQLEVTPEVKEILTEALDYYAHLFNPGHPDYEKSMELKEQICQA